MSDHGSSPDEDGCDCALAGSDAECKAGEMRPVLLLLLLLLLLTGRRQQAVGQARCRDLSEALYLSDYVLLVKMKSVRPREGSSGWLDLQARVVRVLKPANTSDVGPRQRIGFGYNPRLPCRPYKRPVAAKRRYIVTLRRKGDGWILPGHPIPASKKMKKVARKLFCGSCGQGPRLRRIKAEESVKMGRWRHFKCRLLSGKYPKVSFTWYLGGVAVKRGKNFKLRSRRSGSVLNVRGHADTAGEYRSVVN